MRPAPTHLLHASLLVLSIKRAAPYTPTAARTIAWGSSSTPSNQAAAQRSARPVCGSSSAVTGALRSTRVLLHERKAFSASAAIEASLESQKRKDDTFSSSSLELNLLEDPTAGLASGPAEELTPTELETRVRVLVSSYTPSLYRLLYTPFVDVIGVVVREKLVPEGEDAKLTTTTTTTASARASISQVASGSDLPSYGVGLTAAAAASSPGLEGSATVSTSYRPVRPEEIMARWFTDGAATLKHPHETAEAMGKRRWAHFCRALEAHWADMEEVMPLTRVVRRHGLREDLYVPLFRQLAMELADPTKRASALVTLPGLILSLANGRAPRSLGLPEHDTDRIQLVSKLFLGVAQETGDTDLAYLALQLLRANNMQTPFAAQKQLTNVFAAASRIETDWQARGASLLVGCYRKWLDYYREVQLDNKAALEKLAAAEVGARRAGEDTRSDDAADASERRLASSSARCTAALKTRNSKASAKPAAASHTQAAEATCGAEGEGELAGQYRYFTSRRQDDITRITALEENIEAAVRGRAAELQGVRVRRRRRLNEGPEGVEQGDPKDAGAKLRKNADRPRRRQESQVRADNHPDGTVEQREVDTHDGSDDAALPSQGGGDDANSRYGEGHGRADGRTEAVTSVGKASKSARVKRSANTPQASAREDGEHILDF
ncbi:hypothetical protein ABL78_1538 [Leptomonas seymouri]|uniref:Uncharacterized protein n=1 Tax=Leptomonas seymouri TaxID=5684 RepID=A0A0N0P7X8_LEPSE|nr:hypothetical protein ABL78_1538 [Leptomonas seymouri]|eukprot:KPI89309.1 hypothetical protein ABL78_1538 [Leptomonas seymouri]